MTLIVKVINPLVGNIHELAPVDVENWSDIINQISDQVTCDFEVLYGGVTYTGSIIKSISGDRLLVAFNESDIILPGDMCLILDCSNSPDVGIEGCYNTPLPNPLPSSGRLMMLDDEGCPMGYVTIEQLTDIITSTVLNNIDIPTSLCDLLNVTQIPTGNLTASDRILTTSGGCTLKSVPQNQVICS